MGVCYHLTIPASPWSACDAVVQEASALQARFGGMINHLYPSRRPGTRVPRFFWGVLRLPKVWQLERRIAVHHFYNPDPYPFAVLSRLHRPIVYTISAGVQPGDRRNAQRLAQLAQTLIVTTAAECELLRGWGIDNVAMVRPGMDLTHFSTAPLPPALPPTLLMGSAPWTREQFRTKGVDALLAMAQQWPELHLVFLWRGLLYAEMLRRVRALGLQNRVEVINRRVDVKAILAKVHAAVAVATGDAIIKSYPHSLLEALAAGRPVLVSAQIPMAQDVATATAGILIDSLESASLAHAFQAILDDYAAYSYQARALSTTFSLAHFLDDYATLYQDVTGATYG